MHNRFYCPQEFIKDKQIIITDNKQVHHIVNVLRFNVGDNLVIFDGLGKDYEGTVKKIEKKGIEVAIEKISEVKANPVSITLACAIPKKEKFDFIVEKCTELGVGKIIPVRTEKTEVVFNKDRMLSKVNRWRQIAINASEQSQRSFIPEIEEMKSFKEVMKLIKQYDIAILPALPEKIASIQDALRTFKGSNVIVFIGPEGDFTRDEIEHARSLGVKLITLGQRVLKVDTAAIYTISVLSHILKSNQ
ncbi:MAG: 16S rRNA (uracil(1498)-N(3))-methyltransferase [Candidatus Omnitrophota bacterium]